MAEVADVHGELFAENRDLYGADVAEKIEDCLAVTEEQRAEGGRHARTALPRAGAEALDDLDFLIVPTLPFVAPEVGATWNEPVRSRMTRFTRAFNDSGWPALALPCGTGRGRPARVAAAGRPPRRRRTRARSGAQSLRT